MLAEALLVIRLRPWNSMGGLATKVHAPGEASSSSHFALRLSLASGVC